jgi:hypothetical protein
MSGAESFLGESVSSAVDFLIPGGGPLAKRVSGSVVAECRRNKSTALRAARESSGLGREDLAERIEQCPRLVPLLTRLLYAAAMNGHDPILRAMGAAFGDAARHRDQVDECEVILTALADINAAHVEVLRRLAMEPPRASSDGAGSWGPSNLPAHVNLPASIVPLCVGGLISRGLVTSPSGGYGTSYHVTPLGRTVLDVLDQWHAAE